MECIISNKYEIVFEINKCDIGTIYCVKEINTENKFNMIKFKEGFINYFGIDYLKKRFYDISRINIDYVCKPVSLELEKKGYCIYRDFGKNLLKDNLYHFTLQQKLEIINNIILSLIKAHDKLVFLGPISMDDLYYDGITTRILPYWLEYPAFNYKNFSENQNKFIFSNNDIKKGEKIGIHSDIFYAAKAFNYILFGDYNNRQEVDSDLTDIVEIIDKMLNKEYSSADDIYNDFKKFYDVEENIVDSEECIKDEVDYGFNKILLSQINNSKTTTVIALKYLRQQLKDGEVNKFLTNAKSYLNSDKIYRNQSIDENLVCSCIKICMENYRFEIVKEFAVKLPKNSIKFIYYNAYIEGKLERKTETLLAAIDSLERILEHSTYKYNIKSKILILNLVYLRVTKNYNAIIELHRSLEANVLNVSTETYYLIYKWIGDCLSSIVKYDLAIKYLKKCITYIENQPNRATALCECLSMIGKIEYASHRLYDGINYYRRAVTVYEAGKNNFYEVDLYFGLFNCFIEMDELEKAAGYIDKLEELWRKTKRMWEYKQYTAAKLVYFIHIYKYDKALKCIKIFNNLQEDALGTKGDFLNRATETEIYINMGKIQEAESTVAICKEILNENPNNIFYSFKFKYITSLYLCAIGRYNDSYNTIQELDKYEISIEDNVKLKLLTARALKHITVEKAHEVICNLEIFMSDSQVKYYHLEVLAEKARILKLLGYRNDYDKTIEQFIEQIRRTNLQANGKFADIVMEAKSSKYEIMRKTIRNVFKNVDDYSNYNRFIQALELVNKMENEQLESQRQLTMLENVIKVSQNSIQSFNYEYIKTSFAEQLMHISNAEIVKIYLLNGDKLEKVCQTSISGNDFFSNIENEIKSFEENKTITQMEIDSQESSSLVTPIVGKENNIVGQVVLENRIIVGSFSKEIKDFLSMLCIQIGIILENALLYENVENNYLSTVKALANTIEAKDEYTRGHCERVTDYAMLIAENLNCTKEFMRSLEFAGILHDIGKIGIPKRILHKPTKLDKEEYDIIKTHPEIGRNIISNITYLKSTLEGIYQHHEKYDGTGYPKGLAGKEISLMGRILAVADTYDAMTSSRPYRRALPKEVAVDEILKNKGSQFDPQIADIFISVISAAQ